MPLKEKFSVPYGSPRNRRHGMPCRPHGYAQAFVRRQKGERGQHRPWPSSGLLRERQSEAE